MRRELHGPIADLGDINSVLPINNGGTSVNNKPAAIVALGGVVNTKLGVPYGVLQLGPDGKVASDLLPPGGGDTIEGSQILPSNTTSLYIITNFDSYRAYTLSAISGNVSRVDDVITYTSPGANGAGGFILNGTNYDILISAPMPNTPVITSPANNSVDVPVSLTVTTNAFSVSSSSDTHQATDWEIATDSSFTNIVKSSINDTTNLVSWMVTGLTANIAYYIRARHKGVSTGYGLWSASTFITTKASLTPSNELIIISAADKAANDYFGNSSDINSDGTKFIVGSLQADVSGAADSGAAYIYKRNGTTVTQEFKLTAIAKAGMMILNIASGGSVRVQTNSSSLVDQTYTSSQSVSIPDNATVMTITGTGGTGGSVNNPGQPYIAPTYVGTGVFSWYGGSTIYDATYEATSIPASDPRPEPFVIEDWPSVPPTYEGQTAPYSYYTQVTNGTPVWEIAHFTLVGHETLTLSDPGQPYIAPSTTYTTGSSTTVTINGNTYTFAGGYGGAATPSSNTIYFNAGDAFGNSVAISNGGLYAVAGAPKDKAGTNAIETGSVFVTHFDGTTWLAPDILQASDASSTSMFGISVAIDDTGTRMVIGATGTNSNKGAAYIFTRSGNTWSQEAKLVANDGVSADWFGYSVSVSGDGSYILVGSMYNASKGAVYVYSRTGTTWSQESKLVASDPVNSDRFGFSVAISGDGLYAIIGADRVNSLAGAAYTFKRTGANWVQQAKLTAEADDAANNQFGYSVAINSAGDVAIVSAKNISTSGLLRAGAVYIFTRSGTTWARDNKLTASNKATDAYFGYSASISSDGNYILATATDMTVGGIAHAGCGYIFN